MSKGEKLYVKDWGDYQHYKDRKPTWIKLKTDVFSNYGICKLSDPAKLLLIAAWTIASKNTDGSLYDDFEYVKKSCHLSTFIKPEHWLEIKKNGFLLASNTVSNCTKEILESVSVSVSISESNNKVKVKNEYSEEFLEFWKIYPPNRGAKPKAFESYQKSRKETDHETIIRGARSYAAECSRNGTEIKFIAHPTTWLNQKRWEVDYTTEIRSTVGAASGRKSNFDDVLAAAARIAAREVGPELHQWDDVLH